MSKYVIHKSFFKQNPLDKMSAATFADYSLSTLFLDDLNAEIEKIINSQIKDERKERILADKITAEQLTSGEDVVTYMRKNHDNLADPVFCKRALIENLRGSRRATLPSRLLPWPTPTANIFCRQF